MDMIKPEDVRARMPHARAVEALERGLDAAINDATFTGRWPAILALGDEPMSAVNEIIVKYTFARWNIRLGREHAGRHLQIEAP